ncbi:MAG: ROK family protein [Thermodesulfovibrionales bacterium]
MSDRYAIGVDLGGTNLRVALVSGEGRIVEKTKVPSTGDVFESLRAAVRGMDASRASGVGIGVAGLIDRADQRVISSPNIPYLDGKSFRDLDLGLPVVVENDANAAALGENWLGAGRKHRSFVLMTLGTGIGGGVVHEGRLLSIAAEVGHMSVDMKGEKCPCGNYGCLENYASARAIQDAAIKALERGVPSILKDCCRGNIYKITPEEIYRAAFDGDNLAREVLKEAGRYLGAGIANLINMMSPEAVVLAGGLVGAWDIYIKEAINEASKRAFKGLFERVSIIPSSAGGDDVGVLGAAALVLHEEKIAV